MMKKEKRYIICILLLLLVSTYLLFTEQTTIQYFSRPVYKTDPFQNYTNDEVRTAINYSVTYLDNPNLLQVGDYPAWIQWKDYESRVTDASYSYWVVCYAFNI